MVTALEFRLFPIDTAYAGMLVWDRADAEQVLRTWARWAADAPDEVTTSFRILQLPPLEEIPEPVRGRQLAMIDGAVLGDDATAEEILAELRELEPEIDTFARVPSASLMRLHMDPEGPTPGVSATTVLGSLPDEAVDAFLATVGARHGAEPARGRAAPARWRARPSAPLARGRCHSSTASSCSSAAPSPRPRRWAPRVRRTRDALVAAMAPWANGRQYLNFLEEPGDPRSGYDADSFERLQSLRASMDPDGTLMANHQIAVDAIALPKQR